jgi:hypothetical protein
MLTRKRPETISTKLTIEGQQETIAFKVEYHNRTAKEVNAFVDREDYTVAKGVLHLVKSWEAEYELDTAGIEDAESDRPGLILAVIAGFHEARRVQRKGN